MELEEVGRERVQKDETAQNETARTLVVDDLQKAEEMLTMRVSLKVYKLPLGKG